MADNTPLDPESIKSFGDSVQFGRTSQDYARHRAGFPDAFFASLLGRNWISAGMAALDLGTGTGTVARGLAAQGLSVVGIDIATELLEEATQHEHSDSDLIEYRVARAEQLEFNDQSFDLVTAGQCWHWFDRAVVALQAWRVLQPGGRIVIAHFDWLPYSGNVVEATEQLILKYNPSWASAGGAGIYPQWLEDLHDARFVELETFSFDLHQPYSHKGWRGRIRASAGVKASLPPEQVARFDAELSDVLRTDFPGDPMQIPHRVWVATGKRPA